MPSAEETIQGLIKSFPNFKNELEKIQETVSSFGRAGGDSVKFLAEHADKLRTALIGNNKEEFKKVFETISKGAAEATEAIKNSITGFQALQEKLKEVQAAGVFLSNEFKAGLAGVNNETFKLASEFVLLGAAAAGLDGSAAFDKLSINVKDVTGKYEKLLVTAKSFFGLKMGDDAIKALSNTLNASEYSRQFEMLTLSAVAKSGTTSLVDGDKTIKTNLISGGTLDDHSKQLDQITAKIQASAIASAHAMKMPIDSVMKDTLELLGTLPNEVGKSYSEIVDGTNGSTRVIGSLELLKTVATGTGQSFETVLSTAGEMFANWGSNAKDAAERTAMIGQASRELSIPFEQIKGSVKSIDDGFKMWGNSAESTLGVMKQITQALKEQGLGYAASLDIVNQLAGAMRNLGIERKAFIGMNNGLGGTAIGSGLQVEQMIQNGDWGKVAGMMQKTLSEVGGSNRVVSMKEAIDSPEQEQTFMAQRMALGNIFGINDTGAQNRLMDVMSNLQIGNDLNVDGKKALSDAFLSGQSIQEKQNSNLENMYSELLTIRTILASREAYANTQAVFGSNSTQERTDREIRAEEKQKQLSGQLQTTTGRGQAFFSTQDLERSVIGTLNNAGDALRGKTKDFDTVIGNARAAAQSNTPSHNAPVPHTQMQARNVEIPQMQMPIAYEQNNTALTANTSQVNALNNNLERYVEAVKKVMEHSQNQQPTNSTLTIQLVDNNNKPIAQPHTVNIGQLQQQKLPQPSLSTPR